MGGLFVLILFIIAPILLLRFGYWMQKWIVGKCPKCKSHKHTIVASEECKSINEVLVTFICNECGYEFKSTITIKDWPYL